MRLKDIPNFFKDIPKWNEKCYAVVEQSWQHRQSTRAWFQNQQSLNSWIDSHPTSEAFLWDTVARHLLDKDTHEIIGSWQNSKATWKWQLGPAEFQRKYKFSQSAWQPPAL